MLEGVYKPDGVLTEGGLRVCEELEMAPPDVETVVQGTAYALFQERRAVYLRNI